MLTVFTKEGEIVCSHETPNASAEQASYAVSRYQRDSPAKPMYFCISQVPGTIY